MTRLFISFMIGFCLFSLQAVAKDDIKSKDCNRFACAEKSQENKYHSILLKNRTIEELACFVFVDRKKKVFKIAPGGSSRVFNAKYRANYHYFSWNCGTTKHCPMYAKRIC